LAGASRAARFVARLSVDGARAAAGQSGVWRPSKPDLPAAQAPQVRGLVRLDFVFRLYAVERRPIWLESNVDRIRQLSMLVLRIELPGSPRFSPNLITRSAGFA
jgi:hypothetical protein